jgi:peptidoglycan hydrolase-like protein with peptidoglycan-binding domain
MSPAFQGLDRAVAPAPATAKQMLDAINGRWWNVYIGGPESGGHGWSPDLIRQYARHGIDRFMLTYVGRQSHGPLTRAQGQADAREAVAIAKTYGYGGDVPLCLDVELSTFNSSPSKTVEYARAWCATVRKQGARPGVYANPAPLAAMAKGKVLADFVWIASWVSTTASRRHPHEATGMPANLWRRPGQRAWQYGGIINGKPCNVMGLNVDLNVADLACLAPAPGGSNGTSRARPTRAHALRRGDRGAAVVRLTHRLSVLRSRKTEHAYLDGPRSRFDAETETALKAFQAEHRLLADGAYGRLSAAALLKAIKREKDRRRPGHQAPTELPELVHEYLRLDAAADRAWQKLDAYGRRQRGLVKAKGKANGRAAAQAGQAAGLAGVTSSLARIEGQLGTLVDLEKREAGLATAYQPAEGDAPAPTGASTNGSNGSNGSHPELSDEELDRRIHRLDRRLDRCRKARIARYARVEQALPAPAAKPRPHPHPHPRPARPEPAPDTKDQVRALQSRLNHFSERYLEGIAPLVVDGVKGAETNKRIRTAKYYLGYAGDERRSVKVKSAFVRRLRHPRSPRYAGAAMLARAASRRKRQRTMAARAASAPIEGTPKHIIDTVVLRIAAECGIHRSPAENDAANARHGTTVSGGRSDHQGPPAVAWAADISNGGSPTPEMDKLARSLAKRFDIAWPGFGLVNATHGGYRFQLIYRTSIGGNHYNHVHFGVRDV